MRQEENKAILSPLGRADGSASYSSNGFSVTCAVNGPLEVQRRDELPEEAALDVVIKPLAGVGGIRERHFESVIQNTLRQLVLVGAHPRTLVQVTIQVTEIPEHAVKAPLHQAQSNLSLLPALIQVACLAFTTTSISLSMTLTSVLVAVTENDDFIIDPRFSALDEMTSIHVVAFSSLGDLLLVECEGTFSHATLDTAITLAERKCRSLMGLDDHQSGDVDMHASDGSGKDSFVKSLMQEKASTEQSWRQASEAG